MYSFKECLINTVAELKNRDIEKEALYHVNSDYMLKILRFQNIQMSYWKQ